MALLRAQLAAARREAQDDAARAEAAAGGGRGVRGGCRRRAPQAVRLQVRAQRMRSRGVRRARRARSMRCRPPRRAQQRRRRPRDEAAIRRFVNVLRSVTYWSFLSINPNALHLIAKLDYERMINYLF
jgi:hypothetical protein